MTDAPLTLDDVRRDLARALKLIEDMRPEYERRQAMYNGTAREYATSPALRSIIDKSAEAHPLGFAHIPCDAVVDKATFQGFTAADDATKARLSEIVDALDLTDDLDDWHTKLGYFGDYYAIVDPADETETGAATSLSVSGSSPLTTVAVYSKRDASRMLYGAKAWRSGEGATAQWSAILYYNDETLLLETPQGTSEGDKADAYGPLLDETGEPDSWRVPHDGGRPLLVHYAIGSKPYGTPLHAKAFGAQDAITKISAVNLATVDAQGFPSRYALADPLAAIDDDIDEDFGTDGPDTAAADRDGLTTATSGASRLRDVPGTIKLLRGIKSVGTFEAAQPDGFLKNLDWYVRAMAVQTGTPLFEFDLGGEQPSGESRRRASLRLNKRVEKFAQRVGRGHVALADTMLAVLGVDPAEAGVGVTWAPIETETDADGLELVAAKIANGVPVSVALLEAGYSPEEVAAWYPEGADGAALTPTQAAALAAALADFGKAAALGVVTEREIAAALPRLLTDARGEGAVVPPAPAEAAVV